MKLVETVCLDEIKNKVTKSNKKPCVRSRGHIFSLIIMVKVFFLMKSRTSYKTGHVESKTKSLGQILEKPCVGFRGHIFCPIIMKLGQNLCLDEVLEECENGSCQVKD